MSNEERVIIWAAVSTIGQADEDKFSMEAQVNDALALCDKHGWQVVDTIRINGHSRNYRTLAQLAAAGRANDEPGFDKLIAHLDACDFTAIICRDANRFARKTSLLYEIVDTILEDCGARIYSLSDGWVDQNNADMWLMVKGYEIRKQMQWIRKEMARGRHKLIDEHGIPGAGIKVWSHMKLRDEKGKVVALVPDPAKRQIIEDAARMAVDGVGWWKFSQVLFERYGHGENGKPFYAQLFYHLFYNPWFWGDTVRNWRNPNNANGQRVGPWILDEGVSPPPDVVIHRKINEPALSGTLAAQLKAELLRRLSFRPKAHKQTHKFSGLLICDRCGHHMVYSGKKNYHAYVCASKFRPTVITRCDKTWRIAERTIITWITPYLVTMLERKQPDLLARMGTAAPETGRAERLQVEVESVEQQIRKLIIKQSAAAETLTDLYDEQIAALAQQLETLRRNQMEAARASQLIQMDDLQSALADLTAYETIEQFFSASGGEVNQLLFRLMGRRRLVIRDHAVTGTMDEPYW